MRISHKQHNILITSALGERNNEGVSYALPQNPYVAVFINFYIRRLR